MTRNTYGLNIGQRYQNLLNKLPGYRALIESSINKKPNATGTIGTITLLVDDNGECHPIDDKGNFLSPTDLMKMPSGYYDLKYIRRSDNSNSNSSEKDDSDQDKSNQQNSPNGSNQDKSNQQNSSNGSSGSNQDRSNQQSSSNGSNGSDGDDIYDETNKPVMDGQPSDIPDLSKAPSIKITSDQVDQQADQIAKGIEESRKRAQGNSITGQNDKAASPKVDASTIKQNLLQDLDTSSALVGVKKNWKEMLKNFLKKSNTFERYLANQIEYSRRQKGTVNYQSDRKRPIIHRLVFAFDCSGSMDAQQWSDVMRTLPELLKDLKVIEYIFVYWAGDSAVFNNHGTRIHKPHQVEKVVADGYSWAKASVHDGTDISTVFCNMFDRFKRQKPNESNKKIPGVSSLNDISALLFFTDGQIVETNWTKIKDIIKGNNRKIGYILTSDATDSIIDTFMLFDPSAKREHRIFKLTKADDNQANS